MDAPVSPLGLLCYTSCCCISQALQLGWTVGGFSPLKTCIIVPSGNMGVGPQVGGFQVSSSSGASGPCIESALCLQL